MSICTQVNAAYSVGALCRSPAFLRRELFANVTGASSSPAAICFNPVACDAFRFGLYTGMRLTEVNALTWTQVDIAAMTVRLDHTKRGEPLAFPVTRQLSAILARRFAERKHFAGEVRS